jgi:hypothetical protein
MALYSSSLYIIEQARSKKSLVRAPPLPLAPRLGCMRQVNSLAAGCVAGTVVAVHTRKAPIIALSAGLSGVLMLGVDAGSAAISWLDEAARTAQTSGVPDEAD